MAEMAGKPLFCPKCHKRIGPLPRIDQPNATVTLEDECPECRCIFEISLKWSNNPTRAGVGKS